jgi:hypothetical protein
MRSTSQNLKSTQAKDIRSEQIREEPSNFRLVRSDSSQIRKVGLQTKFAAMDATESRRAMKHAIHPGMILEARKMTNCICRRARRHQNPLQSQSKIAILQQHFASHHIHIQVSARLAIPRKSAFNSSSTLQST